MAETYKWIITNVIVRRGSDGASIPNDPGNKDWIAYLSFSDGGGITTSADPLPTATDILNDQRAGSITELLTDPSANAKVVRAVMLVILDEINVIRGLLVPSQTARTVAQLKAAIQAKINAGAAD